MAALLLLPAGAAAAPSDPTLWPDQPGTDPELTATANSIRFAGVNRYETNEALGLALRGAGDFPFDTSDPTGASVAKVGKQHWWGAVSCPRSIIVVAGDNAADSLAAASLSDPTDRSDQPRLTRVAASDTLFDPPGGLDRVDTAYAPIVMTTSSRSGATALAAPARATASDLARGGCTTAHEAIIVGGSTAVPTGVEAELVGLGYDEVFRVAGADRYDTAARVAMSLGTGTPPPAGTDCMDPSAEDGKVERGYYGNAVIEYREDAQSCRVLGRTVIVTDGTIGADALAAGWWSSYWQVPLLLTGPGGSLPEPTKAALRALRIDTVVVLGGTARIPKEVEPEIKALAGTAALGRFSGDDRYATSVRTARAFGGWWGSRTASFGGDVVCLTASGAAGSPDALAAGPWCARLGAAKVGSPVRAQAPVEGARAQTLSVGGVPGGHTSIPVLLVPPGGGLPPSVADLLRDTFGRVPRCTAEGAPVGCAEPGFAVVVGGGVSSVAVQQATDILGGAVVPDRVPVADGFATRLDLDPVFAGSGPAALRACYGSDTIADVRWLSMSTDATRHTFLGQRDVLRDGWYQGGASAPNCQALPTASSVTVAGVGTAGQVARSNTYDLRPASALSLSRPIEQPGRVASAPGAISWTFDEAPAERVSLVRAGVTRDVLAVTLGLDLTSRVDAPGVGVAGGRVSFTTAFGGEVSGTIRADGRQVDGGWELAGVVELGPFADGRLRGGFRATISGGGSGPVRIAWAVDGLPTH